jgi:hypothetical protein
MPWLVVLRATAMLGSFGLAWLRERGEAQLPLAFGKAPATPPSSLDADTLRPRLVVTGSVRVGRATANC